MGKYTHLFTVVNSASLTATCIFFIVRSVEVKLHLVSRGVFGFQGLISLTLLSGVLF